MRRGKGTVLLLSELLSALPDAALVVRADGRILYANALAEHALGYRPGSLVGTPVDELVPDPDRPAHAAHRERFGQASGARPMGSRRPLRARRADGMEVPVDVSLGPATWEGERVTIATFRDRTAWDHLEASARVRGAALEAAANAVAITDRNGRFAWVNAAFSQLTGYSADEAIGATPRLLRSGRHDEAFYQDLWSTVLAGNVWQGTMINRRKDGSTYVEEQTITPVASDDGRVSHFVAIKQDVTERRLQRRIQELGFEVERGAPALRDAVVALLRETLDWGAIDISLANATELEPDAKAPEPSAESLGTAGEALRLPLFVGERRVGCLVAWLPRQAEHAVGMRSILESLAGSTAAQLDRANLLEQLERQATTDALTGLHNRRALMGMLESECARARRYSRPLSVAMFDLDHFKEINDTHGHQAGDAVLVGFATRTRTMLRGVDVLGRFGGEEFLAVFPETPAEGARTVCERLCAAFASEPWARVTPGLRATVSVGVAELRPSESVDEVLRRADAALYDAKRSGRNRVCVAPPETSSPVDAGVGS